MFWRRHSDEFSIILPLGVKGAEDIVKLRQLLVASPYRDDSPHVTLVQSIHDLNKRSDKQLYKDLYPILSPLIDGGFKAKVVKITNAPTADYGICSLIDIVLPKKVQSIRSNIIKLIKKTDCMVKAEIYHPHTTIRLGVALDEKVQTTAAHLFPTGSSIELRGWALNRLVAYRRKRLFYEIVTD